MPTLTGSVSFTVVFNLSALYPYLTLQASTTIPDEDKPNLIGDFTVTQPDGLPLAGVAGSVSWDGSGYNSINVPLTICSDRTYQRGPYKISFFAACSGYTYTNYTRTWEMSFRPATLKLVDHFDLFTPALKYTDATNYQVGDYDIISTNRTWDATFVYGEVSTSNAELDLLYGGSYYDSLYHIQFSNTITYSHQAYAWLSVSQPYSQRITRKASIPPDMATMLTWMIAIKDALDQAKDLCRPCCQLEKQFDRVEDLYQFIRARVCAQNTDGLAKSFDEYYKLTHNYQARIYVNTNEPIPAYDFTTGCTGSGGGGGGGNGGGSGANIFQAYFTATVDDTFVINIPLPSDARIISVMKGINMLLPADYSYDAQTDDLTLISLGMQIGETIFITYASNA